MDMGHRGGGGQHSYTETVGWALNTLDDIILFNEDVDL